MEHPLTKRELDVMKLVAEGETNDGIGLLLGISPPTVATHMSKIRLKLGVHSKAAAVSMCMERGYIR
jgi:DNA-binding CsgD family transcriptional regulator